MVTWLDKEKHFPFFLKNWFSDNLPIIYYSSFLLPLKRLPIYRCPIRSGGHVGTTSGTSTTCGRALLSKETFALGLCLFYGTVCCLAWKQNSVCAVWMVSGSWTTSGFLKKLWIRTASNSFTI